VIRLLFPAHATSITEDVIDAYFDGSSDVSDANLSGASPKRSETIKLSMLTCREPEMLAPLTLGKRLLANVPGELAFVTVRAVPTFDAGQLLTDAFVLIAEKRRRTGVQSASNLGPRRTGGPRLGFFAAWRRDGRAPGIRRFAAARDAEDETTPNYANHPPGSSHAVHLGKMIAFGHGRKAHSRMRRLL
jgi:hypothetical protein